MAGAIGPGSWVICIDISYTSRRGWCEERLTLGGLYQVGDCWVDGDWEPVLSIVGRERVAGSREWGHRVGYSVSRFRPAFEGDQTALLEADEPIRVDA